VITTALFILEILRGGWFSHPTILCSDFVWMGW